MNGKNVVMRKSVFGSEAAGAEELFLSDSYNTKDRKEEKGQGNFYGDNRVHDFFKS